MSAENVAGIVAAACSAAAALAVIVAVVILSRRVGELREMVRHLDRESVPLVRDARVVMDQAATEMERVGDVLASAEAVSGTVDSASRLAYRLFANPVVKVLAFSTGAGTALRRLFTRRSVRSAATLRRTHLTTADSQDRSAARGARRDMRHGRRSRVPKALQASQARQAPQARS